MVLLAGHQPVTQMKSRCSSQELCLHLEGSKLDTPPQWLECGETVSHWVKSIGSRDIQNQVPVIDLPTLKELKEIAGWKEHIVAKYYFKLRISDKINMSEWMDR